MTSWHPLCPVLIFDDGSTAHCPLTPSVLHSRTTLNRFEPSAGYIERRNQLAMAAATTWALSLDDDSHVVSGDIEAAAAHGNSIDNLLALSFPIFNPTLNWYQNPRRGEQLSRVRSLISCAYLIHRQRFFDLGGYETQLVHQGEEMVLGGRARSQ